MSQNGQEGARRTRGVEWGDAWLRTKSTDEASFRQQNKKWPGQRSTKALSLFFCGGLAAGLNSGFGFWKTEKKPLSGCVVLLWNRRLGKAMTNNMEHGQAGYKRC